MGVDESMGSFPILPSISAADLSHLCRRPKVSAAGRNFTPIIEMGRRPKLTRLQPFTVPTGHRLIALSLRRDAVEKRSRPALEKLLKTLKTLKDTNEDEEKHKVDACHFVYVDSVSRCALIVPSEFETAIFNGVIEKLDLAENGLKAILGMQNVRESLTLPLRRIKVANDLKLEEGRGQSLETLNRQRRRQRSRTSERRRIFEELQRRAQEELEAWLNPVVQTGKPRKLVRKVTMPKRKEEEAKVMRSKLIKFRDTFLKNDRSLGRITKNRCVGKLDWNRIARITRPDLDFRMPLRRRKNDLSKSHGLFNERLVGKARKRVALFKQEQLRMGIGSVGGLECIPWSSSDMDLSPSTFKPDRKLLEQLSLLNKDANEKIQRTLADLMSDSRIDLLPSQSEFEAIATKLAADDEGVIVRMVRMRDTEQGVGFVDADNEHNQDNDNQGIMGAVVQMDDGAVRFVPGERVSMGGGGDARRVFVPGQRFSELQGVFVPGACFRSDLSDAMDDEMNTNSLNFLPGILAVENGGDHEGSRAPFVAGRIVDDDFVRGQTVVNSKGDSVFVHGETLSTSDGLKFVAGVTVDNDEGKEQFVPGVSVVDDNDTCTDFYPGQLISVNDSNEKDVQGCNSVRFVSGRFIANDKTESEIAFEPGQVVADEFVPGQHVINENGDNVFVPGVFADANRADNDPDYTSKKKSEKIFVPGIYHKDEEVNCKEGLKDKEEYEMFMPGIFMYDEDTDSDLFVSGKMHKVGKTSLFVPGSIEANESDFRFVAASSPHKLEKMRDVGKKGTENVDLAALKINSKVINNSEDGIEQVQNGAIVKLNDGFVFLEQDSPKLKELCIDSKTSSTGGIERVEGRMERVDGHLIFVPGCIDGVTGTFVPGKLMGDGKKVFVPGLQLIEIEDGSLEVKNQGVFVPGRLVLDKSQRSFVPGVVLEDEDSVLMDKNRKDKNRTDKNRRKSFKPSMEIDVGPQKCLIPGQITMTTKHCVEFVPGELSSTSTSSVFVPSVVLVDETNGNPRLLRGQMVETETGPHVLSAVDEDAEPMIGLHRVFKLDKEHVNMVNVVKEGRMGILKTAKQTPIQELWDVEHLDVYNPNEIKNPDVINMLKDLEQDFEETSQKKSTSELNSKKAEDATNEPSKTSSLTNGILHRVLQVMRDAGIDETLNMDSMLNILHSEMNEMASEHDDWVNPQLWLQLAKLQLQKTVANNNGLTMSNRNGHLLMALMAVCLADEKQGVSSEVSQESKCDKPLRNEDEVPRDERLIASRIADRMSALLRRLTRTTCDSPSKSPLSDQLEVLFKMSETRGETEILNCLLKENSRLTEDRNTLIDLVESGEDSEMATNKIASILASDSEHVSKTFVQLSEQEPEIVDDVIKRVAHTLKGETKSDTSTLSNESESRGLSDAAQLMHTTVMEVVRDACHSEVDDLIEKLENVENALQLSDEEMRHILRQAIGLARFLRQTRVADSLTQVLNNPVMVSALKSDEAIRELLAQILLLRKLARRDLRRRRLLNNLEASDEKNDEHSEKTKNDEDEDLGEFVREANAFLMHRRRHSHSRPRITTRSTSASKRETGVKTSKDISMNTFLKLKSRDSDSAWLSSFLSDSLRTDIPIECSKALILLKNGFQAIVPREASRAILRGEASYTLIDDTGVHFHIAENDKGDAGGKKDKDNNDDLKELLDADPLYHQMTKGKKVDGRVESDGRGPVLQVGARAMTLPNLEEKGVLFSSLEQYRPHNFDRERKGGRQVPEPPMTTTTSDNDINALRDFYSKMGTHQRAMRRLSLMQQANENREAHQSLNNTPRHNALMDSYSGFATNDNDLYANCQNYGNKSCPNIDLNTTNFNQRRNNRRSLDFGENSNPSYTRRVEPRREGNRNDLYDEPVEENVSRKRYNNDNMFDFGNVEIGDHVEDKGNRRDAMALADSVLNGDDRRIAAAIGRRSMLEPQMSKETNGVDTVGCDVLLADMRRKMSQRKDFSDLLRQVDNDPRDDVRGHRGIDEDFQLIGRSNDTSTSPRALRSFRSVDENRSDSDNYRDDARRRSLRTVAERTDDELDLKMSLPEMSRPQRLPAFSKLDFEDENLQQKRMGSNNYQLQDDDGPRAGMHYIGLQDGVNVGGRARGQEARALATLEADDHDDLLRPRALSSTTMLEDPKTNFESSMSPLKQSTRPGRSLLRTKFDNDDDDYDDDDKWRFEEQNELAAALSKLPKPKTMRQRKDET